LSVSPFNVTKVQLLGTPGLVAQGDSIAITFNAPINETDFCSSWSGTGDATLGGSFTVATITDGTGSTDDSLSLSRAGAPNGCTTISFGSIDLGSANFVSGGNVTFSGSNVNGTKIVWTASTDTLMITLGAQNSGVNSPGTATPWASSVTPSYTTPITDVVGDPVIPSPTPIAPGQLF